MLSLFNEQVFLICGILSLRSLRGVYIYQESLDLYPKASSSLRLFSIRQDLPP